MDDCIEIFTDGAASGNPGPGGYGIVMRYKNHRKEMSGGFKYTTNNRMELLGVIIALESVKDPDIPVKIYSDSKYVVDAINKNWIHGWKKKGFENKANVDLWQRFLKIHNAQKHSFIWVKGHADNAENTRCDQLAVSASKQKDLPEDFGYGHQSPKHLF